MAKKLSNIEVQAEYFSNIPIVDKTYRASVHLENEADEKFWDTMLQECRPGKYFYVYHSKGEEGNDAFGCTQCLKYKDFLSDRFFVCIDSDLRYVSQEHTITGNPYILQTYAYSWENHFCYAERLERTWRNKAPDKVQPFSFAEFIKSFSSVVYSHFIQFLTMRRRGFKKDFPQKRFDKLIPQQCCKEDLSDNGQRIVNALKNDSVYVNVCDESFYQRLGVEKENVYLHIKGHVLYTLIRSIGRFLCYGSAVDFEKDVLLDSFQTSGYWQVDKIREDISRI